MRAPFFAAVFAIATLGHAAYAGAISLLQIDDFQDGTTQSWRAGVNHPKPPSQLADGGPEGAGDGYLSVSAAGGAGAGSRLVAINTDQWLGDYSAAAVTGIEAQVSNFGPDDLVLRIVLDGGGGRFATESVSLPAGGGWQPAFFSLDPGALIAVGGSKAVDTLLQVTELRFNHSPTPAFGRPAPPAPVTATLGLDDITAVPEPAALWLVGAALLGVAELRRRSSQARASRGRTEVADDAHAGRGHL